MTSDNLISGGARERLATLTTTMREHERRLGEFQQQQQTLIEAFQKLLPLSAQMEALQRGQDDIREVMRVKQQQDDAERKFGATYRVSRESLEEGRLRDVRTSFLTVIGFVITILVLVIGTTVQVILTKRP